MAEVSGATSAPKQGGASDWTYKHFIEAAKICETCDRYEEMAGHMVGALKQKQMKLDNEGRNLFSIAYKNITGQRRTHFRHVEDVIQKAKNSVEEQKEANKKEQPAYTEKGLKVAEDLRTKLVSELERWCMAVLGHIDELVKKAVSVEKKDDKDDETGFNAVITYRKMKGDYNRYRAEYLTTEKDAEGNDLRPQVVSAAEDSYNLAIEDANVNLTPTDPTRLGLMLNASVFHYEVRKQPDVACKFAKEAFDKAIEKLDTLNDTSYKDSTLIMQLLRDNLTLWQNGASVENRVED